MQKEERKNLTFSPNINKLPYSKVKNKIKNIKKI